MPPAESPKSGTSSQLETKYQDESQYPDGGPQPSEDEVPLSPRSPMSPVREIFFVTLMCHTQLLTQASLASVLLNLHIIGPTLNVTNTARLSWLSAAYSLTVGTFVLIAGRLGDLYGHRRLFIIGWIWFSLWSLIAGFASLPSLSSLPPSHSGAFVLLATCRAFQGIGPAILLPNSLALLGRAYSPGKRKDMVFALFASTAPAGSGVGALVASPIAVWWNWGWIFWMNAIACLGMAGIAWVVVPKDPQNGVDGVEGNAEEKGSKSQKFDWQGAVAGVSGLILINFAFNQAPVVGWSTPYVYILFILGTIFLAAFFWIERKVAYPLFPPGILTAEAVCVLVIVAVCWSSFGIWFFYVLQFVEVLRGVDAWHMGLQFLPEAIAGVIAAVVTGFLLSRLSQASLLVLSALGFAAGCALAAWTPVTQTYWACTFLSMIAIPWGMDISFPASTLMLSNTFPQEHQGIAASLINTVVNYSISLGLGIAGTVEYLTNDGGRDAEGGFRNALYTGVGLSGLGFVLALALWCFIGYKKSWTH